MESKERETQILAGDIVILPPEEIIEEAISLSGRLANAPFALSRDDFLPHITLAMAYMNLQEVFSQIERIASDSKPFTVVLDQVSYKEMDPAWGGRKFGSSWNVGENDALLGLHQRLVEELTQVDFPGKGANIFVGLDQVNQAAIVKIK